MVLCKIDYVLSQLSGPVSISSDLKVTLRADYHRCRHDG